MVPKYKIVAGLFLMAATIAMLTLHIIIFAPINKRNYINEGSIKRLLEASMEMKQARNKTDVDINKILDFLKSLVQEEQSMASQNGEDGITLALFTKIGTTNKYYVEFGTQSGVECNTRVLREIFSWTGLMMDGGYSVPQWNLQQEMIYPTNIVHLFQKYKVPKKFDLLNVDTDFKDFWILQAILEAGYRPRVIIGEINAYWGNQKALTVPRNSAQSIWDGSRYFGYSVSAGYILARYYGYSLVYCGKIGTNCFWVIDGARGFGSGVRVSDFLTPKQLWRAPPPSRQHVDRKNRPQTTITSRTRFGPNGII